MPRPGTDASAGGLFRLIYPAIALDSTRSPRPSLTPVTVTFIPARSSVSRGVRQVLETRELAEERQAHRADRPVALLADDDLGDALVGAVRVVHLVAIDEQDEICIL